jgi:hypothetical protein
LYRLAKEYVTEDPPGCRTEDQDEESITDPDDLRDEQKEAKILQQK